MEIFDYFLRTDPTIMILAESEFNKNLNNHEEDQVNQKNVIRETMIETIVKYDKMLEKCKTEDEKKILKNMINSIKQQLNNLGTTETTVNTVGSMLLHEEPKEEFREFKDQIKEISPIPMKKTKIVDKNKKNEEALREIFSFIAKQGHVVGKNSTFERVQHESQILSLGEYFFFCTTFNLYNENFNKAVNIRFCLLFEFLCDFLFDFFCVSMKKATQLFKKTGEIHNEVNFNDFKVVFH